MRVRLMSPTDDVDLDAPEPDLTDDLVQDLQLDVLWDAMGGTDAFQRQIARAALLHPVSDPRTLEHRQRALADCLRHRDAVDELYGIAVSALDLRRSIFMLPVRHHPALELSSAIDLLTALADALDRLRETCAARAPEFSSPAFADLFDRVARELDVGYVRRLRHVLQELAFPHGLLMSAGIGPGGEVTGQALRRGKDVNRHLLDRTPLKRPLLSFTLPDRDEAGATALSELRDRSVNDIAKAATQSAEHVMGFFSQLRAELGFYLACCRLSDALTAIGAPLCTPDPCTDVTTSAAGLYDPCLALRTGRAPQGNAVELGDARLLVVTGANHGGKSTLLRALGIAQLMMQAGMTVAAERFAAAPVGRVLTHWAREEDTGLAHGKLDEELERMERIVALIRPGDLLLCNESFASTTEAEGSQIALEVTTALVRAGVRVRTVTHLYDFARAMADDPALGAAFLRAPRACSGERSFRLEPGEPLPTSYGLDLYDRAFGTYYADAG